MSNKYVFDSSALLAIIKDEKGNEVAESFLEQACMSCINISEVIIVLYRSGMPKEIATELIESLISNIEGCNYEDAKLAAGIKGNHDKFNISLGDSYCLALGEGRGLPIVTADKIWGELSLSTKIICIR